MRRISFDAVSDFCARFPSNDIRSDYDYARSVLETRAVMRRELNEGTMGNRDARSSRVRDNLSAIQASQRRVRRWRDETPATVSYEDLKADSDARWGVGQRVGPAPVDPRVLMVAERLRDDIDRGARPDAGARDLVRLAGTNMPAALREYAAMLRDHWDSAETILGQHYEVTSRISGPGQLMGIGEGQRGASEEQLRNSGPPGSYRPDHPETAIDTGRRWIGGRFGDALRQAGWKSSGQCCEQSGLAALAEEHRRHWARK